MSLRAKVKAVLEVAGTASGMAALSRYRRSDAVAILAYHNVVPDDRTGRGDASLHLPLSDFLEQIDRLRRTHEIVALEAAADEWNGNRPRAVVTFDDAYRGAVALALPELARQGIPATVFVSPGLLGSESTWWDEMAEAELLSAEVRQSALHELQGRTDAVRARVFGDGPFPTLPPVYGIATRRELEQHVQAGASLGSHGWAHEHLPSLEPAELEENLHRTLDWLEQFPGRTNRWLALPYGAWSMPTSRTALEIGHTGVLRIRGGLWRAGRASDDRGAVPRINVPAGVSPRGLELRTSGLFR